MRPEAFSAKKIGCQGTIGTTSFGQEEEAKAGRSVRPRSQEMQKIRDKLGGTVDGRNPAPPGMVKAL